MSLKILEDNCNEITIKVIKPLWESKFKKLYENAKLDENDFISLAGEELTKAFKEYDTDKSSVCTYARNVLNKKAMTELRDCTQRDKRKLNYISCSLNQPEFPGSSEDMLYEVEDKKYELDDEFSELRVGNFINSLSNQQLRVLILKLLDFDTKDMPNMLNISKNTMNEILKGLKSSNVILTLYRRNF